MSNVMLDLETYGNSGGCIILSIGAAFFSESGLGEEFYRVVNMQSCKDAGLTTSQDTIDWWGKQSAAARAVVEQAQDPERSIPLKDACEQFNGWLGLSGTAVKLWGNGSDFDNVILIEAFKAAGVKPVWKFYNHRCHRTLKNLAAVPMPPRVGVYHNALDDAKTQALHAIALHKALSARL